MKPTPTLYSMAISHYCVSVDRMLAFKGVHHRTVRVPYHDKRKLIRETGQDYVPALAWKGRIIPWNEIPRYLDQVVPVPPLYPYGREGEAEVLEEWGHQALEERVWRAVVTRVPPILGSEHERWVFEELQSRTRGSFSELAARRSGYVREMEEYLGKVELLLDGRDWVLGVPSAADFGIFGAISPLLKTGGKVPSRFRATRRWIARIQRLPG